MSWNELHCLNKFCNKTVIGYLKGERVIFDRILASQRNVYIVCPECKNRRRIWIKTKNNYLKYLTDAEKLALISEE
jgi:hypothetical protein